MWTWFRWHTFSKEKIFQWVSRLCCFCRINVINLNGDDLFILNWEKKNRKNCLMKVRCIYFLLNWSENDYNISKFWFILQEFKFINPSMRIDWPGDEKPIDQPICGFNNELCPKDDTHITSMVIAATLALMLFCGTGKQIQSYETVLSAYTHD